MAVISTVAHDTSHHRWRGNRVGYHGAHHRVRKIRGHADHCVFGCQALRYEWANLTGDYTDVWDYAQMCGTCHNRYDVARKSMEPGFRVNGGWPMRVRSNKRGVGIN